MPPLDWDMVMGAKTKNLPDDDADDLFSVLSNGEPGDEADVARWKKLFLVTRAVMVNKHQQAESIMEDVEKEAVVTTKKEQEKERQIKQLQKQIEELEKYGPGDGGGTQRAAPIMREQLRELEDENEQLRSENKDLQRDLTNEKNAAEKYSARISDLEKDLKELRDENDQMRQDVSDYKMQMEAQRVNVVAQHGEEVQYRTKLKSKNHELAEAMEEIQNLTDQNEQLMDMNNNFQQKLGEAAEQMSQITENDLKLKAVLQKTDSETDRMREENKILKNQVDDLTDQVQSKRESDDVIMVAVNNKIEEWKELVNEKNRQILELQEVVSRVKEQLIAANMDTDKTSVSALGQIIMDKEKEINELTERVEMYTSEMERSAAIIEDLKDELHRAEKGAGGDRLQGKIQELQNENKNLKDESHQLKERLKSVEEDAEAKDKELTEALAQKDLYERGEYGLKDAVDEIKLHKNQVKQREKQLEEFAQHINKAEMKINDILDENEELRYRLGLDPKEPLDMVTFKKNKAVRKEEEKALNFALQGEIERLEEERIELKKRIRKLAQQTGQRAVALGLTAEDMLAVQDFTEELKTKKTHGKPVSTAAKIVREVESEEKYLRVEHYDKEYHRSQLELERKDEELSKLNVMVRQMEEENKHLESGLKEVMEVMKQSGKETSDGGEPVTFPSIDKMLGAIEAKKLIGSYDTSLYLKEQMDIVRGRNEELRHALRESRLETNKLLLERDKAFQKINKMEKDHLMFQEAGIAPGVFQPLPLPEGMAVSSTEVIASLNEHLIVVLQELSLKETNMKKIETALEDYKRKYAVMRHQQGILYQDYLNDKKEWEGEMDKMKEEVTKVKGEFEENSVKVQEFDRLVDTLGQDDVEVRRRLSEMTRRMTVLRVNEKALTRRHQIMQEVEGSLRKEVKHCRNEMNQMQTTISERMGYLQRFKDMSSFKMAALQKSLEDSVPSADLVKVNRQYHELTEKYRDLLEKGNTLVSRAEAVVGLEEEVKRLSSENEAIKKLAEVDKEKLYALEAAMEELHRRGFTDGANVSVTNADIVSISKKMTMLEMKELNERQRSEHAVHMYEQQRDILRDLESRNKELEDKFAAVTKLNLEMQKTERQLKDELSNSVLKSISDKDRKKMMNLEESRLMLQQEISKLKEISEVAASQVRTLEMQHISHEKECQSLRQQLLDFQMQSDEKTIIGKLHRHIVQLQVSEGTAVRKLAEAHKKITKLEAHVLRSEQRIDDKEQTLFHNRSEAQNKARYLKRNLQELRIQFAGAVPLSKQEKFSKNMLQLRQDKGKLEHDLKEAKQQKTEMEDRIAELQLQRESLQELIATLKDGRGAAKVAEWHDKIDGIRLEELKQKRMNSKLNQQIKYLEGIIQTHEVTIADFEADNVRVIKEFEERQLRWEQREVDLERQLDAMEKQSSEIAGAASRFEEALGSIPDAKLPLANQLEEAISTIKRNVKIILDTQAESKMVKERNKELEKRAREAEHMVILREKLISELRLRMPATTDRDEIILKATTKVSEAMQKISLNKDYESTHALKIAQSTMSSLQARIQQKDETIVKYQDLLKQAREEMQEMNHRHEAELRAMQQKVHMNQDAAFSKFKEATQQFLSRQTAMKGPTSTQVKRLYELEDAVADQANTIAVLSEKIRQREEEVIAVRVKLQQSDRHLSTQRDQLIEEMTAEMAKKNQEINECNRQMSDMRKEIEILNEEIAVLKENSSKAPTATMKNLVERLKNQVALKEKQHQALSKALSELRADMVNQAQENVRAHAEDENQDRNIQQLIDQHTKQMSEQIEDLKTQLDRFKKELKKRKESEHNLHSELEDVREDLSQKERSVSKCKSDKKRLEHEVEELEKKVERMNTIRQQQKPGEFEKQHELDEMRRRVRLLEDELKKRQTAERPYEKEEKPKTDVLKWEESKKWKRTVEKMKNKIREKEEEMEKLQKTHELTKAALERSVKEKEIVETRARVLSHTSLPVKAVASAVRPDHELEDLHQKNFQLQDEVNNLHQQLAMDRDASFKEVLLKNHHLSDQVNELERALDHTAADGGVTVQEYQKLFEKNQNLQMDIMKLSEENIELRFESEQAKKDLPRMKERINDLQKYNEALKLENCQLNGETARSFSSNSSIKRIGESGKSQRELERTVALLKKVVERLQCENDQLKKAPGAVAIDRVHMYKAENENMKSQLNELQQSMGATLSDRYTSQQKGTAKLMTDFEKMRQELMKEREANEKMRIRIRLTEVHNDHQEKKLTDTKSKLEISEAKRVSASTTIDSPGWKSAVVTRMYEDKIKGLELDLEKKNKLLSETKCLLKDAAEREQNLIHDIDDLQNKIIVLEKYPPGSGVQTKDRSLIQEYQQARLKIEKVENQKKVLVEELRLARQQGASCSKDTAHLDDDILTKAGNYDKILKENVEVRMSNKTAIFERDKLKLEVKKLKKELEHFGPDFFDEIEDLKYNYQQSVEKNVIFEEKLKQVSTQFGLALNIPGLD